MEGHHFWEQQNEIQEVRFLVPKDKRKMEYPFSIPAVRECREIKFSSPVTIFTGENGSGKSTILEAIAVAAGFNPEGGTTLGKFLWGKILASPVTWGIFFIFSGKPFWRAGTVYL